MTEQQSTNLGQRVEAIAERNKAARAARATTEPAKTVEIVQLTIWPEPVRGVPNSALRGALFAAIQGKDRQALKRGLLSTQQGLQIRFTGWQLDQSDLDVWEQALHLARSHPLGTRCDFTAHAFLKALGRSTGKPMHEWLKNVFARLGGCFVEITHDRMTYGGSLLEFYRDEETGHYQLEINPKLKALFDAGFTQIDWQQRQSLKRKPLALWLHGFYASHAKPHPVTVEYLHKLSGSHTKETWKFRQNLNKALEDVKTVGGIRGYAIEDGLVSVDNKPSRSQRRHLARNPKPRKK